MKRFLKFLYLRYRTTFEEFLVEDMIGQIPNKVQAEALEFLGKGKDKLEKWIWFQSYSIQRRAVGDLHRANVYHGMQVYMKVLLALVQGVKVVEREPPITIPKGPDPLDGVKAFEAGIKGLQEKPKEE